MFPGEARTRACLSCELNAVIVVVTAAWRCYYLLEQERTCGAGCYDPGLGDQVPETSYCSISRALSLSSGIQQYSDMRYKSSPI